MNILCVTSGYPDESNRVKKIFAHEQNLEFINQGCNVDVINLGSNFSLENSYYNLETLPEEIDDLRFAILDNSNPSNVDYHYINLLMLKSL
jgi:hypothetical protein